MKARLLTCQGQTRPVREWSRLYKIPVETILARIDRFGYSPEDAILTPIKVKHRANKPVVKQKRLKIPQLGVNESTGQARIWWRGKYHYLGPAGAPETADRYAAAVQEIASTGDYLEQGKPLAVVRFLLRFLDHAEIHYRRDGKPTGELYQYRAVAAAIRAVCPDALVSEFNCGHLKQVRKRLLSHVTESGQPLTRQTVNAQINRVKRMWSWGVQEGLVPLATWQELQHFSPLRKGRGEGTGEQKRLPPVDWQTVERTLPAMGEGLQALVKVHWLLGCRASEILEMRAGEVDQGGTLWRWVPGRRKTAHLEESGMESGYWIGAKCQEILREYLTGEGYVFPGPRGHARTGRRRGRWDKNTYATAVRRACEKAGVPVWSPRQIRKGRADEIRLAQHARGLNGEEAAQAVLGHTRPDTTRRHYLQRLELAKEIMQEMG